MSSKLALAIFVFAAAAAARAELQVEWMPGNSREIPRTNSASRDVPASSITFAPRTGVRGAADFAFAKLELNGFALRPGVYGFADLEDAATGGFWPVLGHGPLLFRGHYGFSFALSAEELAHAIFGPRGAIEIAAGGGHESDHVLASGESTGGSPGSFEDAPRPGDIIAGGGGNFLSADLAMRAPISSSIDFWGRLQDRPYVYGPLVNAPAIDVGLRWHLAPHFEPIAALFAERLFVDHSLNAAKNGGSVGLIAGAAAKGSFGEVTPYLSIDVGNGKGLLINHRELVIAIGGRYVPF